MIDRLLKSHLEPVARSSQKWQMWRGLAVCWAVMALASWGVFAAGRAHDWYSPFSFFILFAAGVAAAVFVVRRFWSQPLDYQAIARQIERENPELHALLLTAVEQSPLSPGGELNYLQQRVILEALDRHRRATWGAGLDRRHRLAVVAHWIALGCFVFALVPLFPHLSLSLPGGLWANAEQSNGVLVTPGDTNLERGGSLVVLARFNGRLPATAELVIKSGDEPELRVPLTKNLDDPVFGGGIPELKNDLKYHVSFSGGRTRDFKIGVFEYPRLEHADVTINYPPYTGVPQKFIKNTRRVSAVEGSTLDYSFYLNKAVASAKLQGTNEDSVVLTIDATNAAIYHARINLDVSHRYQLMLVDGDGRASKVPPEFVLEALKNNPPQVRLDSPRGDQSVSSLEEMSFAANATGAYGLKSYGISYTLGGGDTQDITLGQSAKPGEKKQFNYLLPLESLNAEPDQLLSYYVWADDTGPDGQPRRTTSDIYFAEIKPFDQIFRQAQQPDDQQQQQNNANNRAVRQGGGGDQPDSLADLEKQIVTATFNLQRRESAAKPSSKFKGDTQVVQNSQKDAIDQVTEMRQQVDDPALQPYIDSAAREMTTAASRLGEASDKNSVSPLRPALNAEQAAYQDVLKLSAREFQVQRGQRGQRGGQQRAGQRMQRQLNQLDLAQNDNQYETQRQADAQQNSTPEQQQQLQVANRLKELAQRQQDLNQRIRELQASLQEARTEQQRADIREQLKRLTEEQQNVLADVDELRQRMDQADNQQQANQQQQGDQPQQGDQQQGQQQDQLANLQDNQQQQDQQPDGQQPDGQQPGQQQPGQQPGGQQPGGQQPGGQQPGGQRQGGQRQGGQRGGQQQSPQQQAANDRQAQQQQQRQQLEQTRQQVQDAADQLAQNDPSSALASGTRAQQELQQLQDDVRRMNSAQFTQEMRQMRNDANQLAQNQQDIAQKLSQVANPDQRQLSETPEQRDLRTELSQRLLQQENAVSNVLDQMRKVSDKAENDQPILSQQLYDSIRQTQQDDMNSELDSSSELVGRGFVQQAGPYVNQARTNINQLRDRVDQAAQTVLGDDTEALRLAQRELQQLTDELNQAQAAAGVGANGTNGGMAGQPGNQGNQRERGQNQRGGRGDQGNEVANAENGQNPGAQGQPNPGDAGGQGNGPRAGRPGQGGQPGGGGNNPQFANGQNPGQRNGGNLRGAGGLNGTNEVVQRLIARRRTALGLTNGTGLAGRPPISGETNAETALQPGGLGGTNLGPGVLPGLDNTNGGLAVIRGTAGDTNIGADFGGGPGGTNVGGADFAGGAPNGGPVGGPVGGAVGGNYVNGGGGYVGGDYNGPIVDTNYIGWSDRLRVVEEMVNDLPDVSTQVAQIRDRARELRLAYRRDGKKPDWAVVTQQISQPLADVRDRVDQEILKRTSKDALVPLDRDPVPSQYSERVRKYYEQLGKSD